MNKPHARQTVRTAGPRVTVVEGGEAGPTLVSTLGAFARLDSFETDRYQRLAALQERQVAVVETPGWAHGTKLNGMARDELRKGSFSQVGALMGSSVQQATGLEPGDPVSVLGYSMGCSTATAMAAWFADAGLDLRHLTLVEPVALSPTTPTRLFARNGWEGMFSNRHLRENRHLPDIPASGTACWGDRRRLPEPLHLLWGLSRGRLSEQVMTLARRTPQLAVTLIRGSHSALVDPGAVQQLATDLDSMAISVDVRIVPDGHHALWHSRPLVGRLAEAIG